MEIKPTDQLGASLLGRVGERGTGGAFSVSDQYDTGKAERSNRLAQELIRLGIKVTDKAIDARLEEEMILGSTEAMAGVAEEAMETDILTRNFKIAGHRNMTASLRQQEWQSTMLQRIASGEFNDLNPTEFGGLLNKDMNDSGLMEVIGGMSREAKGSMLETMLTGNQTLIAQQQKSAVESRINMKMRLYSVQANTLLEEAKNNLGTNLEEATTQQAMAFVRSIMADSSMPQDKAMELITQFQQGSAKLGLPTLSQALLRTPIGDGSTTLGQVMPTEDLIKGQLAINDGMEANKWLFNTESRLEFSAVKAQVHNGTFTGTEEELVQYITRERAMNGGISEAEANSLMGKYAMNRHLVNNQQSIAQAWYRGDVAGLQRLNASFKEGMDAYINQMISTGMPLDQQVATATDLFSQSNGYGSIVQWVGQDILQPVLSEVINSDGDVLTENVKVFNYVMAQTAGMDGKKSETYLGNLLSGLDVKQADFIMEYKANRDSGSDELTSLKMARNTYRRNLEAGEADRSVAVQGNYKLIESVLNNFSDPSSWGNFLGIDNIKSAFKSDVGTLEKNIGTPTPFFSTNHDKVVYQRAEVIRKNAKELAKKYIRSNPNTVTEENLTTYLYSTLAGMTAGEGDNIVIFDGGSEFTDMFPMINGEENKDLLGQRDSLVNYVLDNIDLNDITGESWLNGNPASYTFTAGMLNVTVYGDNNAEPFNRTILPEQYAHLVEEYKDNRYKAVAPKYDYNSVMQNYSLYDTASNAYRLQFKELGADVAFKLSGYNNNLAEYSQPFIVDLYKDNLKLEGWRLAGYDDDLIGKGRKSVGMGVNSGNRKDPRYKPYFDKMDKGELTKQEAQELTELAVTDHLKNSASMIQKHLGNEYLNKSDDLELAIFKLSYGQWQGDPNTDSTAKIFEGIKEGDVTKMTEGLKDSRFFKMTAGGDVNHPQYEYVFRKLIGAMNELRSKGIR